MKRIYLDNAATTKVDEKVVKTMLPYFTEKYGNASSQHFKGFEARDAMNGARKTIAKSINAKSEELIFTSGGTESNNLVLKGLFFYHKQNNTGKNHIITTKIEHDCILKTCKWLSSQGAKITYLDVDEEGFVNLEEIRNAITPETILVSIIHGNNEVGTIQDLEAIGKICREKKVLFHTDACQSFTKVPINVKKQNIDLMTLNSHKIHGPKGVGALYIREGIKLISLLHGGGQEEWRRSGTENISGIVGFATAVKNFKYKYVKKMNLLRDKLIEEILKIPNTKLNGPKGEKRLCNNVNISFNNIEGESMGNYLESYGICTSAGSACMSHSLESSHVLRAIGLSNLQANSSIRMSLSKYTTEEEINYVLKILNKIILKLRKISPLVNNENEENN